MTITVETRNRVRIVTLNRPAARNAVNPETARALYDTFRTFDADDSVDVAILTGAGGHFCAGYDLKSAATNEGVNRRVKWVHVAA